MSTATKLTDTQLVILAQAAQRPDGRVLPLPSSLKAKGGAATNVLKSLLRRSLIAEQPASREDQEWRRDEAGAGLALAIAPVGLSALGLAPDHPDAGMSDATNGTIQAGSVPIHYTDGTDGRNDADDDASSRPAVQPPFSRRTSGPEPRLPRSRR